MIKLHIYSPLLNLTKSAYIWFQFRLFARPLTLHQRRTHLSPNTQHTNPSREKEYNIILYKPRGSRNAFLRLHTAHRARFIKQIQRSKTSASTDEHLLDYVWCWCDIRIRLPAALLLRICDECFCVFVWMCACVQCVQCLQRPWFIVASLCIWWINQQTVHSMYKYFLIQRNLRCNEFLMVCNSIWCVA